MRLWNESSKWFFLVHSILSHSPALFRRWKCRMHTMALLFGLFRWLVLALGYIWHDFPIEARQIRHKLLLYVNLFNLRFTTFGLRSQSVSPMLSIFQLCATTFSRQSFACLPQFTCEWVCDFLSVQKIPLSLDCTGNFGKRTGEK